MGWVDADAHVVESPLTWDYLTPSEKKFRPKLFKPDDDSERAHWVPALDGVFAAPQHAGCARSIGVRQREWRLRGVHAAARRNAANH